MLKAQELGHELYHYRAEDLSLAGGPAVDAWAYPVSVQRVAGDHYRFGELAILDLGKDVDVVLMRQDPPFDLGYITATHLLERIQGETLVVNDPASVRNAPEKVWVLDFAAVHAADGDHPLARAHAQVPRRAWRNRDQAAARLCRRIGVPDRPPTARNLAVADGAVQPRPTASRTSSRNSSPRSPRATSASSSSTARSPARSIACPGEGEIRSNLAVGGKAAKTELTEREAEICAALGPELKQRGLLFVGDRRDRRHAG